MSTELKTHVSTATKYGPMDPQMVFDAGQIIGMVLKHTLKEWEDMLVAAQSDEDFRYTRHIQLIMNLRRELS